jgi:phage gp29-like protein
LLIPPQSLLLLFPATTAEIDTLYEHLTNLSQETALILPEGYNLDFINPQGSPEVFSQLRDSLIKEINVLIAGEEETGNVDAGSRASAQVAQTVRQVRAQELSELLCAALNETLVRWIVDLNFGTNVVAPKVHRDFQIEDPSKLNMTDVGVMIEKVGFRPTKEWIETVFKVDLEEPEEAAVQEEEEEEGEQEAPASADEETETETEEEEEEVGTDDEELDRLIEEILG